MEQLAHEKGRDKDLALYAKIERMAPQLIAEERKKMCIRDRSTMLAPSRAMDLTMAGPVTRRWNVGLSSLASQFISYQPFSAAVCLALSLIHICGPIGALFGVTSLPDTCGYPWRQPR